MYSVIDTVYAVITSPWFLSAVGFVLLFFLLRMLWRFLERKALSRLSYGLSFSMEGAYAGSGFELLETVGNPTFFPLFSVRISFYAPGGLTVDGVECDDIRRLTSICTIPPRASLVKTHSVIAKKRGIYSLIGAVIDRRSDIYDLDCRAEICIYPSPDRSFGIPMSSVCRSGESVSARRYSEDRFFFSGLRAYQNGDPMNYVNFKASARSLGAGMRTLVTNTYDSTRSMNSLILLDLSAPDLAYPDAESQRKGMENGISLAFSVFCETVREGGNVGFACNISGNGKNFVSADCDSHPSHIKKILGLFATLDCNARISSYTAMVSELVRSIPPDADIYLVTCGGNSEALSTGLPLARLAGRLITLSYGGKTP